MADFNFGQMRQDAMTVLEGDFVVRCVHAEATKNSNGDYMIKAKLQIIAGTYAGRNLLNNFNIIPANVPALQMFFSNMAHFGLDAAYFDRLPMGEAGVHQIARDLVGRIVEVNVVKRAWQGVDRENIKSIKPAPAGMGGVGGTTNATALPTALPTATPLPTALPTTEPKTVTGSADVNLPMSVGSPAAQNVAVEAEPEF